MIRVISASFYDENDYSMEFGKFQFQSQMLLPVQINRARTGRSGVRTTEFRSKKNDGPKSYTNESIWTGFVIRPSPLILEPKLDFRLADMSMLELRPVSKLLLEGSLVLYLMVSECPLGSSRNFVIQNLPINDLCPVCESVMAAPQFSSKVAPEPPIQ